MAPFRTILVKPIAEGEVLTYVPTGLCYLGAYLKKYAPTGFETSVWNISPQDIGRIIENRPDLVGFTAFTFNYNMTIGIARQIRAALPDTTCHVGQATR